MEDWICNLQQGLPGSLANTKRLSEYFDNPHMAFKSIHIAGTNGKGSVTYKSANTLYRSGYKVGIFTSPHVHTYLERIQINFSPISQCDFFSYAARIKEISESLSLPLGWFDLYTLVSFLYFKDSQVDWACIEVGLGGLLDNTNMITPRLSIIVSIGYDHMNILGSTLEEITTQKAGIIKQGVPCVYGPTVIESIILEACRVNQAPAIKVDEESKYLTYDMENSKIAKTGLLYLKDLGLFDRDLDFQGLAIKPNFRIQEFLIKEKTIIIDVSHNISGINRLISDLKYLYPNSEIVTVFAAMKGKETDQSLQALRAASKQLFVVSGVNTKLKQVDEILLSAEVQVDGTGMVSEVIPRVLCINQPFLLLITGTFAIIPEVLNYLHISSN